MTDRPGSSTRRDRVVAAVVGVLALLAAALPPVLIPTPVPLPAPERLVLIGVPGLAVDETDPALLDAAAVGTVVTDTAVSHGGCAADGWATLSAGRPATTGGRCALAVDSGGGIADWRAVRDRAAEDDAALGTLGGRGCVSAVGTAAALGAARPDGTVAEYLPVTDWIAAGHVAACAVTLVDGNELFGVERDAALTALLAQPGTQVWVVGLGPGALREDSDPRPLVVLGDGVVPGTVTAGDGRPARITDVADAVAAVVGREPSAPGTGIGVRPGPSGVAVLGEQVRTGAVLGDRSGVWAGLLVLGLVVVAVAALARGSRWVRATRPWWPTVGLALPAGLQLTALGQWWRVDSAPLGVLGVVLGTALVALPARALGVRLGAPPALLAGIVSVAVLTAGWLGGHLLPGGLLSPAPGRVGLAATLPGLVALLLTVVGAGLVLGRSRAGRPASDPASGDG